MRWLKWRALTCAVVAGLSLSLAGCPDPVEPGEEDAGAAPPDACNSLEEALGDPACTLALGEKREAFISFADDRDWYSFRTPADANARTLIHITGGYAVPNTAVNFAVNLLREDGQQSLARRSDRHGQGAPRPIDLILPFAEADRRLVLLVSDDPVNPSRPQFDARSPYRLTVDVVQDPDVNEPNDTVPTAITLTPEAGGALAGTQQGHLSTEGDVDRFRFAVPGGRKVLHLSLNAPALTPPPPFRLSYELLAPNGMRVAEGVVQNEFLPVELATARLSTSAGEWTVVVKGYESASQPGPKPGDLRLQYTLAVRVFDETDPSEGTGGNDTLQTARVQQLSQPGTSRTVQGRIGYVPDPDWYRFDLEPHEQPTTLRYRLRPGTSPGRFPALPGVADREVRVLQQVQTGGTQADAVQACKTNAQVCPRSFDNGDVVIGGLHAAQCEQTPPRCLWSLRAEHPSFDGLRNFEGVIPIPPHSSALSVFLLVQDQGNDWADDLDYTLELEWRADPDDASRFVGGAEAPVTRVLGHDEGAQTYPLPPSGGAYELSGTLSHGYGFLRSHNPNNGQGVRAPADYDAVPSDRDRFEIVLPAVDETDGGIADRAWELQWEIQHGDGGRPHDLALELTFCDGDRLDGGVCTPVSTGSKGGRMTLQYTGANLNAWHNVSAPAEARQPVYARSETATRTVVDVLPYGCFCFERRFMRGGRFYVGVVATDRRTYEELPYRIRTAYTDYPQSYTATDGGVVSCPAPTADAGCWFTREP